MSEKPKRVEVGQRWRESDRGTPYTVTAVRDGEAQISFYGRPEEHKGRWYGFDAILCDTFLGAPTPTKTGAPAETLNAAAACSEPAGKAEERARLAREIVELQKAIAEAQQKACVPRIAIPDPLFGYRRELHHPVTGVPMTALEAVKARKPPEPWVPSCDIDADIPDA